MNEKELIRKKLKVTKTEILEGLLDKISKYVGYTDDGEIFFKESKNLSDIDKIGLYLIARHFAHREGTIEKDTATNKVISEDLNINQTIVGARISDLKKQGYVNSKSRGVHIFFIPKIEEFLKKFNS